MKGCSGQLGKMFTGQELWTRRNGGCIPVQWAPFPNSYKCTNEADVRLYDVGLEQLAKSFLGFVFLCGFLFSFFFVCEYFIESFFFTTETLGIQN